VRFPGRNRATPGPLGQQRVVTVTVALAAEGVASRRDVILVVVSAATVVSAKLVPVGLPFVSRISTILGNLHVVSGGAGDGGQVRLTRAATWRLPSRRNGGSVMASIGKSRRIAKRFDGRETVIIGAAASRRVRVLSRCPPARGSELTMSSCWVSARACNPRMGDSVQFRLMRVAEYGRG